MGTCFYCGKMIYLDWIAERGYHRACHERAVAAWSTTQDARAAFLAYVAWSERRAAKRRISRARNKKLKWESKR